MTSASPPKQRAEAALAPAPRVRLVRRLSAHVHLGELEGISSSSGGGGHERVAVKVRSLVRESDRGGADGVRAWQEWRAVRRLLQLQRRRTRCGSDGTEAATWELSDREHVVRYVATVVETECFKLVMEYCMLGDLLSLLAASDRRPSVEEQGDASCPRAELVATRPVPQETARRWVLHVARGLRFLHAHGVAHRDLCLDNILLSGDPRAPVCKVANFGASLLGVRRDKLSRDRPPTTHHLHYTAPEVVAASARGAGYDPLRADVWSLGIVFFVLLTGSPLLRLPFPGCKDLEVVRAIGCRGVLRLWGLEANFSAATLDLLDRMLDVDPASRLATAAQVLEHPAMLAAARREAEMERELAASPPPATSAPGSPSPPPDS